MKRLLLLGASILLAGAMNAQVIFSGVSPANIVGNYEMTYGEPTGGWGSVDLLLPANSILDTLVLYDDAGNLGCNFADNPTDLEGKIAILFRGDCEFGLKASNAEQAGAIACVIINNEPGSPIPMAPGVNGENIDIPAIMISDVDGATLLAEMENGPVSVFIGNKLGFYEYDLGIAEDEILRPLAASIPLALVNDGGEFPIDVQAKVHNYGSEGQVDVTLQAIITLAGDELYNETSTAVSLVAGESLDISLPTYNPTEWVEGNYTLKYIVNSLETDDYDYDNEITSNFKISPTEFSYAALNDTTMLPNTSGGIKPATPGDVFSLCIYFNDPNASRLAVNAMSFVALKGNDAIDPSIEGEEFFMKVIGWYDNFTDINDAPNPMGSTGELVMQSYVMDTDASGEVVTAAFDDENILILEDNTHYLFCASTFNDEIFLGNDPSMNYDANLDYYLRPLFPIEVGGSNFNPVGFESQPVPSISVSFIDASTVSLKAEEKAIKMKVYPNPSTDVLTVDFNKNEVNKVELVSVAGQIVSSQTISSDMGTTTFNVTDIESGVYIVKVTLKNNLTHTMRVVINH